MYAITNGLNSEQIFNNTDLICATLFLDLPAALTSRLHAGAGEDQRSHGCRVEEPSNQVSSGSFARGRLIATRIGLVAGTATGIEVSQIKRFDKVREG